MTTEKMVYDLIVSEDLKQILKEFESESLVAQLLLQKYHSFDTLVGKPINYISISKDGMSISYLTPDRIELLDPSSFWVTKSRFQCRPGALVTKLFNNVAPKEVEKFSNLFRSQVAKPTFDLKVVKGEDIRKYYYWETYADGGGTLGASCMKHSGCKNFFDIYVNNKDTVSMLIMTNQEGKLMGRSLLWTFDSHKIMDRIYTINDELLSFYFKKWAIDNGYLHKSEQNWYNTKFFEQLGQKKQELKLEVKIHSFSLPRFPYIDTFKFIDIEKGVLYNYIPDEYNKKTLYTLCAADGGKYDSEFLRFDGIDRVFRHRGETTEINYGPYSHVITHCNNVTWSEVNSQCVLLKDSCYDEVINDYIFAGEFAELNNKVRIEERREYIKKLNEERERKRQEKLKNPVEQSCGWFASEAENIYNPEEEIEVAHPAPRQGYGYAEIGYDWEYRTARPRNRPVESDPGRPQEQQPDRPQVAIGIDVAHDTERSGDRPIESDDWYGFDIASNNDEEAIVEEGVVERRTRPDVQGQLEEVLRDVAEVDRNPAVRRLINELITETPPQEDPNPPAPEPRQRNPWEYPYQNGNPYWYVDRRRRGRR